MIELNEVFDEGKERLAVTNLYPKLKIPQIFAIDNTKVAYRMCSYTGGGDANKNIKPGDKMMHVIALGVTDKGLGQLKTLGDNPIAVIDTIFNHVMGIMKFYRFDVALFRVKKNKTGGAGRQMQVIVDRLIKKKGGGKFVMLKELYDFDKKYNYILVYKKNADLTSIPGMPEIMDSIYKKVDTDVGDAYINVETGKQVSKLEAIAGSIAAENDKRSDQAVASRAKISRRALMASQYSIQTGFDTHKDDVEHDKRLDVINSKPPVYLTDKSPEQVSNIQMAIDNFRNDSQSIAKMGEAFKTFDPSWSMDDDRHSIGTMKAQEFVLRLTNILTGGTVDDFNQHPIDRREAFKTLAVRDIYRIGEAWSKLEPNDYYSAIKELTRITMEDKEWASDMNREAAVKEIVELISKQFCDLAASMHKNTSDVDRYTPMQLSGLHAYVGSSYKYINDYLLGLDEYGKDTAIEKWIESIDSAFENGVRLPKGTKLFRGQQTKREAIEVSLENKHFYFKNFVSTSMAPIIFGGYGRAYDAMDPDALNTDASTPKEVLDSVSTVQPDSITNSEMGELRLAFVISGAEKIKTIVTNAGISSLAFEAEVILPRGTVLRIDKMYGTAQKLQANDYTRSKSVLMECTVVSPEQLSETTIYDGDKLLEGELVESDYSFSSFVGQLNEAKAETPDWLGEALASFVDINNLPERFIN
ncbi:Alt-like RNA polymerase ADP-ribosyltransferase [Citrobacter phage CF1 ERZ-2017]|uniref:NAD(+)--arginine ADP-ribosyltransferase n=1 Tax=Citrobacter phage CF1 ERZ-2017 TaxID=2267236 RepID=A0A2H4YGH1_9CAUD|nr:Alt-like RNA polymerase ADP-ribosyltransferase [Citrobacter phage CF1 ERZ-2017]AUE23095.1 ADP-ribosyltransferase [Citrobacter phage CF1 ERZ-2017]